MSNEEKEQRGWEALPERSGEAFAAARQRALEAGRRVVESDAGVIYELSQNGVRKELKRVAAPTRVTKGRVITLK